MLVCIGLSFFNAEKFLDIDIGSILNQTYTNWKLFLLDDGSTDGSLEIALSYATDRRIRVISDGENKGLIYRLNQLVSMCDTKYFARMDADDIMHPDRLKKQITLLECRQEIDVVGSWAYSIDVNNIIHGILRTKENPNSILDVFSHKCFIHPSITGKTSWFRSNRYSQSYIRIEDQELWSRTIKRSVFFNMTEPLLFYREVGVPYLKKYLQSMAGERKLITVIYSKKLSLMRICMLFKNCLKSLLYILLTMFRLQNILIKSRSNKIGKREQIIANLILKNILLKKK